jgi:hypothetical protein
MRSRPTFVGLLVLGTIFSGCTLTGVLSAPDPDALELLEQQRRQELLRAAEQQALDAHEKAVRSHADTTPPPPPPSPLP